MLESLNMNLPPGLGILEKNSFHGISESTYPLWSTAYTQHYSNQQYNNDPNYLASTLMAKSKITEADLLAMSEAYTSNKTAAEHQASMNAYKDFLDKVMPTTTPLAAGLLSPKKQSRTVLMPAWAITHGNEVEAVMVRVILPVGDVITLHDVPANMPAVPAGFSPKILDTIEV